MLWCRLKAHNAYNCAVPQLLRRLLHFLALEALNLVLNAVSRVSSAVEGRGITEKPNRLDPLSSTSPEMIQTAVKTLNGFTKDREHRMRPPAQKFDLPITGNMDYGFFHRDLVSLRLHFGAAAPLGASHVQQHAVSAACSMPCRYLVSFKPQPYSPSAAYMQLSLHYSCFLEGCQYLYLSVSPSITPPAAALPPRSSRTAARCSTTRTSPATWCSTRRST